MVVGPDPYRNGPCGNQPEYRDTDNRQERLLSNILFELRRLNDTFACKRFLDIPSKLDRIDANTLITATEPKFSPKITIPIKRKAVKR